MRHFASPIDPLATHGHRDNFIVVFNEWSERRYGAAYVRGVLEEEGRSATLRREGAGG